MNQTVETIAWTQEAVSLALDAGSKNIGIILAILVVFLIIFIPVILWVQDLDSLIVKIAVIMGAAIFFFLVFYGIAVGNITFELGFETLKKAFLWLKDLVISIINWAKGTVA